MMRRDLRLFLITALLTSAFASGALAQAEAEPVPEPNVPSPMAPQTYDTPEGYQTQPPPQQAQPQPQPQPVYAQPAPVYQVQPQGRLRRERYREGDTVPPGARVFGRRKMGLIISGAVLFGVTYLISGALVVAIDRDLGGSVDYTPLVPIFGPLISSATDGSYRNLTGLAILSGLTQAAGVTMLALGLVKRQYIEYYATTSRGRRIALRPDIGFSTAGTSIGATLSF